MKTSLRTKVISMVLIPVLLIGVGAIAVSSYEISDLMDAKMVNQLKVSAYAGREFYETMNREAFFRDEEGVVRKGDFTVTGNFDFVDTIQESGNIYATFFYGDERIVTNVLDEQGQRMIGTKAGEQVIQEVLNRGNDFFSQTVRIGDEEYYGYYVPVRQPETGEVIGMFFTGDRKGQIAEEAAAASLLIAMVIIAIMVPTLIITVTIALRMSRSLMRTVTSLEQLATGELQTKLKETDLKRGDEVGDIARSCVRLRDTLAELIGNIHSLTDVLFVTAKDIEGVVGHVTRNTGNINGAIESLSGSAMQQAISMEGVSAHMIQMSRAIQDTVISVKELGGSAGAISETSKITIQVLNQLDAENNKVIESLDHVYHQTNATHDYVEKIVSVMEMIREIADATNMLSLNATIEAARAGEAGRGFAIVAEQVKKLAAESSDATLQIEEIIGHLNNNSTRAVHAMEEVKGIVQAQNKQIMAALENYDAVNDNIHKVTAEVGQVSELSQEIGDATGGIAQTIADLSALSEENAQSTKVTSKESEELSETMQGMEGKAISLNKMAEDLQKSVKLFKI